MKLGRRQFLRGASTCAAGAGAIALGFNPPFARALETREYKLTHAKQTRNNCCYCSVGCGLIMYGTGDGAINSKSSIFHIEGDPDHPVSRGSLCPKGAGLIDFIHSETRSLYPEYRAPGSKEWKRIDWDEATTRVARLLKDDRDKNFVTKNEKDQLVNRWATTAFFASSAASNETGALSWKFGRALGMVAIENQARTCHGPTVSGLVPSFGRGAMSNNWVDIKNADLVMVMGGNAAEAHPVGFKWAVEAKITNGAKMICVDPRFNRTAAVSDFYAPIRAGSDVAFLLGVINYLLNNDAIQHSYVLNYTNAAFLVNEGFSFNEGLFSGYNPGETGAKTYDKTTWNYQRDSRGFAKRDETLKDPRCVINLLRDHVSRFTPEVVSQISGTPVDDFLTVCKSLAETAVPEKTTTWLYALGFTHHTNGSQIIRCAAMIQLLLGNMGMPGGGVNALRGHSNIQGYTDLGLLSSRLPGYMNLARDDEQDFHKFITTNTMQPDVPETADMWRNYPKFYISLMKTLWGDKATAANNWGYNWLPKLDHEYDLLTIFERMGKGEMNGVIAQGFNILGSAPDKNASIAALSKLKFLISFDPLQTETASFWENFGEFNDVKSEDIQTEVFRLPCTCFAEEFGSITNSARWLQWHYKGAEPPGEAWSDAKFFGTVFTKIRELYKAEGGPGQEPLMNMSWDYADPKEPTPEEIARETNGYALADIHDANGRLIARKGELLSDPSELRDDGTTSSFCWVFCGSWSEAGNQMARRDNTDTGWGCTPGWAWSWPSNRRILYNRACLDPAGNPWDPKRRYLYWNGTQWTGSDVPDYPLTSKPNSGVGPFIMAAEGVGRLFACESMVEGPFPNHYEPMETPVSKLPYATKSLHNPAVVLYKDKAARLTKSLTDFPYVGTTYSITELFRTWTKHALINAILQPEQFVEISEDLANELGIKIGDMVKVSSFRGQIIAKAVVTKRMTKLNVMGKPTYQVGLPSNWGFKGRAKMGYLTNTLTPPVGDANSQTPEFKAFLVNVEKHF